MAILAKYRGDCCYCGAPIKIGVDYYDPPTKKNWHGGCFAQEPPDAETFALAARLGFLSSEEAASIDWTKIG